MRSEKEVAEAGDSSETRKEGSFRRSKPFQAEH
jgi:hypothetical protein